MTNHILGIDLGTSGVKVGLLNLSTLKLGHIVIREYDNSPEQNPDLLFNLTLEALKQSVDSLGIGKNIKAIGLTGQMHGAILCDESGDIISPLINWKDRKYSGELVVRKMKQVVGTEEYDDLGIDFASGLTGAILFGIKENYPDLFARIKSFVLPTDFIRGKLLGGLDYATDQTNAFGTGLFNTKESRWHEEIIRKLGLSLGLFPEVHQTSDIAGYLSREIASMLSLEKLVPIVFGGGDNQMSMLGSGLISHNSPILINIGTAAQISMVITDYIKFPGLDTRCYFDNSFALVRASLAGGGCYKWLREEIQKKDNIDITYFEMDKLASDVPPGADGLVFCPGPSRIMPRRKKRSSKSKSFIHRARAVMDGVIMELIDSYQEYMTTNTNEIMVGAGNGLQNSRIWTQITADIFKKPLCITNFKNAIMGAAIMGASGVGLLENMDDISRLIKYEEPVLPNSDFAEKYQDKILSYWNSTVDAI